MAAKLVSGASVLEKRAVSGCLRSQAGARTTGRDPWASCWESSGRRREAAERLTGPAVVASHALWLMRAFERQLARADSPSASLSIREFLIPTGAPSVTKRLHQQGAFTLDTPPKKTKTFCTQTGGGTAWVYLKVLTLKLCALLMWHKTLFFI